MAYNINIELTDLQAQAWHVFIKDAQEWVETLVFNEVRRSMDSIYEQEVARMVADPDVETMPANKEDIIANADLTPAVERDRVMLEQLRAMHTQPTDAPQG